MKTDISHLPHWKQRELNYMVTVLHQEFEAALKAGPASQRKAGRIEMIVLYGSHARGNWVYDYVNDRKSDYDILILVNQQRFTDVVDYWLAAEERVAHIKTPVEIITHTYREIRQRLKRAQYFFSDIQREGIVLYARPGRHLPKPGVLTPALALDIAREHYDRWMPSARHFYEGFGVCADARRSFSGDAVHLQQAAERAYACYLLVFSNYRPHTGDIEDLRALCEGLGFHDGELRRVWPRRLRRHNQLFDWLKRAYDEPMHCMRHKITQAELSWLHARVGALIELVDGACKARLDTLGDA